MLLSQMNEKAIEEKTDDAKVSAKKASTTNDIYWNFVFFDCLWFYL